MTAHSSGVTSLKKAPIFRAGLTNQKTNARHTMSASTPLDSTSWSSLAAAHTWVLVGRGGLPLLNGRNTHVHERSKDRLAHLGYTRSDGHNALRRVLWWFFT